MLGQAHARCCYFEVAKVTMWPPCLITAMTLGRKCNLSEYDIYSQVIDFGRIGLNQTFDLVLRL